MRTLRIVNIDLRLWNFVDNRVKNHMKIIVELWRLARLAVTRNCVISRILELSLVRRKLEEQISNLIFNFTETCRRLINLVNYDNRGQIKFESLLEYKLRLRHRAFLGINNQKHTIRHIERALNLARKIGVAWGIDDIDFVAVIINRSLLGGDRNTALMLLVTRVHNQRLAHLGLILAESMALLEERINKRRLAMVDVRNNRYISDFTFIVHNAFFLSCAISSEEDGVVEIGIFFLPCAIT